MTKKLKWRLGKLPSVQEIESLLDKKIITKEEAREILFSSEDIKTLKEEVKFLRKLVEKLSNRTQIIETIREVEKPYRRWGWYSTYDNWCNEADAIMIGKDANNLQDVVAASFSSIK